MREAPKKKTIAEALEHAAADRDRAREEVASAFGDLAEQAATVLERLRKRAPKVRLVKAGHG